MEDGRNNVHLEFTESLMDVPSCMDRCFLRPWGFVGLALVLTLQLCLPLHLPPTTQQPPFVELSDEPRTISLTSQKLQKFSCKNPYSRSSPQKSKKITVSRCQADRLRFPPLAAHVSSLQPPGR